MEKIDLDHLYDPGKTTIFVNWLRYYLSLPRSTKGKKPTLIESLLCMLCSLHPLSHLIQGDTERQISWHACCRAKKRHKELGFFVLFVFVFYPRCLASISSDIGPTVPCASGLSTRVTGFPLNFIVQGHPPTIPSEPFLSGCWLLGGRGTSGLFSKRSWLNVSAR